MLADGEAVSQALNYFLHSAHGSLSAHPHSSAGHLAAGCRAHTQDTRTGTPNETPVICDPHSILGAHL